MSSSSKKPMLSAEEILRTVAEATATTTGDLFFRSLAQNLASSLGLRYCFLTETLDTPPSRVSTLAAWDGNRFMENFEYDLADTPCQHVVAGESCVHSGDVRSLFPDDHDLVGIGADSYAGVPFQDASGRVIGHLALIGVEPFDKDGLDLSLLKVFAARAGAELERQRATLALQESESTLRQSEARLRQIIDLVPHPIFAKDLLGRFILVNEAVAEIYGTSVDELLDRSDADFARSAEEARSFRADDLEVIESDRPKVIAEERITDSSGQVRYLETTKIPFSCANSELPSVLGVAVDISKRKQAEDARERLGEQMRQAQKLESLGVLAGGIAHDFNNLLVGILGNASLALEKAAPGDPSRRYLEGIEEAAKRAAELSNQMLAYSGRGRFVVQQMDLMVVIRDMMDLLRTSVGKRAQLVLEAAEEPPSIEADLTEIRQVVFNLVTNAAESMGDEKGLVTVRVRAVDADRPLLAKTYLDDGLSEGRYVALEVIDSGCGMDAETRARIFDPFFTTKFSGRGLGLAAVLGIVRGHGGVVEIESTPSEGTTFRVFFPASDQPAEEVLIPEVAAEVRGDGRTVLVVDDDPTVRQIAIEMLEARGFRVLSAEDGVAALEALRVGGREIVVVLLDMTMPRLDGIETFSAVRDQRPEIGVVLTSGYSQQEASRRLSGEEGIAFVQKPFAAANLDRAIGEALRAVAGEPARESVPVGPVADL